jgi:hypothetical protein
MNRVTCTGDCLLLMLPMPLDNRAVVSTRHACGGQRIPVQGLHEVIVSCLAINKCAAACSPSLLRNNFLPHLPTPLLTPHRS